MAIHHGLVDYFEYFGPDFKLHPDTRGIFENQNTKDYLREIRRYVEENLRKLQHAPGIMMQQVSR